MSLSWHRLHRQLLDYTLRKSFETAFAAVLRSDSAFGSLGDLRALLERQHRANVTPEIRNSSLRALVLASQGPDERTADAALTALLLALWPGLDATHSRLRRWVWNDPEDVAGEILTRATEIIRTMDLAKVTQIAAAVVMGTGRDVFRRRCRLNRPILNGGECLEPSPEDRLHARELWDRLGRDEDLVCAVVFDGLSCAEAGATLGLKPDTALKRFQRVRAKARNGQRNFSFGDVRFGSPKRLLPSSDHQ